MTDRAPRPAARLMATVMPRSLNEPVGLPPSTLRNTSQPVRSDSTGAGSSGVPPSLSVITGVSAATGSRSRYSAITPRHGLAIRPSPLERAPSLACLPFDAHHAGHGP